MKECQYEVVKAVVVDWKDERKDTICILPTGHGKSLVYQLLPFVLLNLFISNACEVRATYNFLYVDHWIVPEPPFSSQGITGSRNEIECYVDTFEERWLIKAHQL